MLSIKGLLFPTFAFVFSLNSLIAQEELCGFSQRIAQNSQLQYQFTSLQNVILSRIKEQSTIRKREHITIPVVVHVVWKKEQDNISTKRIHDQIQMLNQVFNNLHPDLNDVPEEFKSVIGNPSINFCLAVKDPDGKPSNGIIRVKTDIDRIGDTDSLFFTDQGGSNAWDTKRYLNIWITGMFGNGGYAFPPGGGDSLRDGIILHEKVVQVGTDGSRGNGRVCVHEIGHYLGLRHIWGNDLYAQDPLCLNDDGFSDTPLQWRYSPSCPNELTPAPVSCGTNSMYVNFMDYTPDECLSMFTKQQVEFMLNVLEQYRPDLNSNSADCFNFSQDVSDAEFEIYPNPANAIMKLSFESLDSKYSMLELYDLKGVLILSFEDLLFDGIEILLPELSPGIYLVKIGNEVEKLVII